MKLSSPIYKLKRQAKTLARDRGTRLGEALDQIAASEGFRGWSHLASSYAEATPAQKIVRLLSPGDMVLIGARPGHGKTLLGLELAALARHIECTSYVFSLEYNEQDIWDQFRSLGYDPKGPGASVVIDTSDNICADHIIQRLGGTSGGALIVVDYMQLLDQNRSHPPLDDQVRALRAFAAERGAIVAAISQIDRAFDRSAAGMPGIEDIRQPNPVDLTLFDRRCFLHDGAIRIEAATA